MTRYHATSEGNIPFTEAEELEWDNRPWTEEQRQSLQERNKTACKSFILSKYSAETQRNAALGIYGETIKSEISDHIARIIIEENTVYELIKASDDPNSVRKPVWPEV